MTSKDSIAKILAVFGTRPEAIKMAPVVGELQRRSAQGDLSYAVCVTAQHRHMLDQVLKTFDIRADYDLDLMTASQSPAQVAASVLTELTPVMRAERPDWVVVQGDTTTVASASLAAYYLRVKVAHVEAGLRTHNKWEPFPEEVNRRVTGAIADLHFAPTPRAKMNLLREGIPRNSIHVTGNTVIDALLQTAGKAASASGSVSKIPNDRRVILVTAHRRENFGQPLSDICGALLRIVEMYPDVHVVYPVHPNPSVRGPAADLLSGNERISLVQPMDYHTFVDAMRRSYLILTDSGGVQEEAPSLGKPVLVLRDVTERPEAVEAGAVQVVGTDKHDIVAATSALLDDSAAYDTMARAVNPYGDGNASKRIVRILLDKSDGSGRSE